MQIKSVETKNFGNLPNKKVSFSKGLTVIKGPNEAGKSFSMEAITQGLFVDASTSSTHIREHCRKWGSKGQFSIEMELVSGKKNYKLIRDFDKKKNTLIEPDGTEIKDKEVVRKKVSELLGLPSQLAFEATACIPQEEVEKIGEEVSALREIIEGRLAGSGTDTDKIVKKINKSRENLRSKSGKKGELTTVEQKINEVEDELVDKQEELNNLMENKRKLDDTQKTLEEQSSILEDKENAYKGSEKYISAESRFNKADEDYNNADENLRKFRQAKKDVQDASKKLSAQETELKSLEKVVGKGGAYLDAIKKCNELEKAANEQERKIEAIEEIEAKIQKKLKEIESYKSVNPTELQNAKGIPSEIKGLCSSLNKQLFGVKVELEKDIEYSIVADGKKIKGLNAEMHMEASVKFPGIAKVQIRNLTGEEEPIVDEIKRKEGVLNKILQRYDVKNVDDLENLYKKREEGINNINNLEMQKETYLNDEDFAEVKNNLKKLESELNKEKIVKKELEPHSISVVELDKKRNKKEKSEERKIELKEIITKNKGILEAMGDDETKLEDKKKATIKELAIAESNLDELKIYKCSAEEFETLKRKTESLDQEVSDLKEQKIELNVLIEQTILGAEDIAGLEEKLSELHQRKERLTHKYRVMGIINENITYAREKSISKFSKEIEELMSKILSKITEGKYNKVTIDEKLGVSIYSSEKGEYISIDDKINMLSSGTQDQIYLAARLAILNLIATDVKPPIILDDTFVSFDDMGRRERAFNVLEMIAKDYQVLYFTCHHCPESLRMIELG